MKKKPSAFPFALGDRVIVPNSEGVQGFVSLPMNGSDGICGDIVTLAKPARGKNAKSADPAAHPANTEGRIVFVTWIGDDGERKRGYFTEMALSSAIIASRIAS